MPAPSSAADFQTLDQSLREQALENILNSRTFAEVSRLKRFLEYVVTETIAGRAGRLKGVVIACEVFDKRDPNDAATTTVVRVEAGRLRRRLQDYYSEEGRNDPIRIMIPKGRYSAVFKKAGDEFANAEAQPREAGSAGHTSPVFFSRAALATIVVLLAVLAGMVAWDQLIVSRQAGPVDVAATLPDFHPTIAVLPFDNMVSDDPDNSFAFGLTEDIITDLGSLSALEVISLSSVLPFKDVEITPQEIGAKLGVSYVLRGSVRGTPSDIRVTAQLYDSITGIQLWAERFDRQITDELTLQGELALKVVDSLSISLREGEANFSGQQHTTDLEAWYLYKQAMNLVNPPSDPTRLKLGLQVFEQIIERDPDFAGGYAGTAYIHAFMAFFGHSQSADNDIRLALVMAEKAQTLDPSFGLTYSAQAFAFLANREFEPAIAASNRAVQIAPNDPYVMAYHGFILCANGEPEDGIAFAERALRLDPLYARTPYLNILGVIRFQAHHYQAALNAFLRNRDRGGPLGPGIHHFLAATYAAMGYDAKAASTLAVADLLKRASYDWEGWVKRSWKHQEDSDHILNLVEQVRADRQPQS